MAAAKLLVAKPTNPPPWWPKRNGKPAWVTVRGDGYGWTLSRERKHKIGSKKSAKSVRQDFEFEYANYKPIQYRIVEVN